MCVMGANNVTSAMFNAYLILTLKFEKIKYFWEIQKIWKIKIIDKFNNIVEIRKFHLVSTKNTSLDITFVS